MNNLVIPVASLFALCASIPMIGGSTAPRAEGVIWQLSNASPEGAGNWHKLGVDTVLLQWTSVDGTSFVKGASKRLSPKAPNWTVIRKEPWAQKFIVGLAGRSKEAEARTSLPTLVDESLRITKLKLPFPVSGWYFPVEADPTWREVSALSSELKRLPRPLWISVYDRGNIGPEPFAAWVLTWLPPDVGVLFQDGVGVWARTPVIARRYADTLAKRLGSERVIVVAEAFRERDDGTFRAAEADELRRQLISYRGHSVFLFDGPHYVSSSLVDSLVSDE
jgi:hypothetical protein